MFLYEYTLGPPGLQRLIEQYGLVPARLVADPFTGVAGGIPPAATLLSSMFLHAGLLHLGINMLFLWVFGDNVEDALGHVTFLAVYLAAGVGAGLTHAALFPGSPVPSVGASGAIAGVLGGYLLLFPQALVRTLLVAGPFLALGRVRALVLIAFWFLLQIVEGGLSLPNQAMADGGIAFFAHIGGFVAGVALVLAIRTLRGQPLGRFASALRWGITFRTWVKVVAGLTAVGAGGMVLTAAGAPDLALALQGLGLSIVALFALVDGVRRARGHATAMGRGQGGERALAVGQVLISTVLLVLALAVLVL
ncbi:MAG: rhomboid family intramembrane serine protease [Chloroflexi bacterium]|nr:rhomboid family intramembrane serine protease [Chloroflexota bacterium]